MFFATCFEAFAVFNLYACLQSYLDPFREELCGMKESKDVKIMFVKKFHLNSKWGMHYRIITDILVLQYPMWALINAFVSIFTKLKGVYCEGMYDFKGAYVYLTIIDFISLSIILGALFTYLDIYGEEWKRGSIRAHGMFWCVKGPIMVLFYFGEILLTFLTTIKVIKGKESVDGGNFWPVDAIKNAIYVTLICFVMLVVSGMMARFFSPQDNIDAAISSGEMKKPNALAAFSDAYIVYIPEFFYKTLCCGADSYRLMKKRKQLKKKRDNFKKMSINDTSSLFRSNSMHTMQEMTVPQNFHINS
ncbi:unnamed protein product [Rhizopus stolonifer]